jgi:hypothetical protein
LFLLGVGKAWLLFELRSRNDDPSQSLSEFVVAIVSGSPVRAALIILFLLSGVTVFGSAVIDAV